MQDSSNSSALALELLQSCTQPLKLQFSYAITDVGAWTSN